MSKPIEQLRTGMDLQNQTDPITFRHANLSDLDAILKIEQSSFPAPWPRSVIAGEIDGRSWSRVTIATHDDTLLGYIVYWIITTEVHLLNLAVDPIWRRNGIAKKLMAYLIETSQSDSLAEILLEVRLSNLAAKNLYRQLGFEEIAIRPKYYSDNLEDALVMLLQLDKDSCSAP
jgi:ribosomal-protein-alanine N-acetyltransferase